MTKQFLLLISALSFAGVAAAQTAPAPTGAEDKKAEAQEACKEHMGDQAKYDACLKEQEAKK